MCSYIHLISSSHQKQGLAAHTRTAYPTKVGHDVSNGPLYIFTIPCKLNTFTQHDPEP